MYVHAYVHVFVVVGRWGGGGGRVGYCWLKKEAMIHVDWGRENVRVSVCFGS